MKIQVSPKFKRCSLISSYPAAYIAELGKDSTVVKFKGVIVWNTSYSEIIEPGEKKKKLKGEAKFVMA